MGHIGSSIAELSAMRWTQPRKGQVYKARRVLFVEETSAIIELETGAFTIAGRRHTPNGNWAVMDYGLDRFTGAVLDGLVRLGVLTKEQVAAHKQSVERRHALSEREYAKKSLASACETLGIPVPALPEESRQC